MSEQQVEYSWQNKLKTCVYLLLIIVLLGYVLKIGQNFLLPIFISIISVYIVMALTNWLGRLYLLKYCPEWFRRILVIVIFLACTFAFTRIVIGTGQQILNEAPIYQHNLEKMIQNLGMQYGWAQNADWNMVRKFTIDRVNLQSLITNFISAISSLTSMVILIVVYAFFLIAEQDRFSSKLMIAFPRNKALKIKNIVTDINQKIGDYLAVKTLINVILSVICYAILWIFGVEYALFWALVIGLLNYIPYIGSLIGVIFPVTLALLQFGSPYLALLLTVCLTIAQMYVGNVLEPKMIGKQINLSGFVVLVSLSLWSSLWGIAGAILAIPLTAIVVIILAEFEETRPYTYLLMDDIVEDIKE